MSFLSGAEIVKHLPNLKAKCNRGVSHLAVAPKKRILIVLKAGAFPKNQKARGIYCYQGPGKEEASSDQSDDRKQAPRSPAGVIQRQGE